MVNVFLKGFFCILIDAFAISDIESPKFVGIYAVFRSKTAPTPSSMRGLNLLPINSDRNANHHYNDVIMGAISSQITSLTIAYSTVYSDADQRKHQSSASLAFVRGIHRRPVNSPHKWPLSRKMFPLDDVIMMMPHRLPENYRFGLYMNNWWQIQWNIIFIWNISYSSSMSTRQVSTCI